jgi:hypothetical protein
MAARRPYVGLVVFLLVLVVKHISSKKAVATINRCWTLEPGVSEHLGADEQRTRQAS